VPLDRPGQQRAGSDDLTALTRRRLIAAAALVAGVGVTDAACTATRRGRAALTSGASPSTTSQPTPGRRTSSHHSLARHVDGHPRSPAPGGGHDDDAHHGGPGRAHETGSGHEHGHHKVEHVDLPKPRVAVRRRPAYYLDDLVANAPHNAIGLTIDDGPDPEWTPKVLRLLDKHDMKASFCVVGVHAAAYPRLIRDIHRAGHAIVNHSYTHVQPFAQQSERRIVAEIVRTQHAIERATKVTPQLFRSPGGDWSHFVYQACAAYGLEPLDWDVDPQDWRRPGTRRIRRAMLHARPNDIVLCHDGGGNRAETVRALRRVLPAWRHRGWTTLPLTLHEPPATKPAAPPTAPPSGSPTPAASGASTP
jgi:peptidoglycan/xylan/chitin deacetylase (PgdA/CDA1 family)